MKPMATEEFIEAIRRPLFNYNMGMGQNTKGARTRQKNATAEIHQLILAYVRSEGAPMQHLKNLDQR